MRAHKFHVISFNLDGRELFEFNLFDVCWRKKYTHIINFVIPHYTN